MRLSGWFVRGILVYLCLAGTALAQEFRRLPVKEYVDKMKAGWIGQMLAVGWGWPTEFKFQGRIIPPEKVPRWEPGMVNMFKQDDLYVEMTFLRTLELHGFDVSSRQAGIDFANSGYRLWHANRAGRDNLREGVAPPDSGHPSFNNHADDIDYQIEADYAGLIAPGMPNVAIALGEKFGRLVNYGDGLYGGQFVGGMYAAAFFEDDPKKIVEAGLACIPTGSQYAEAVRDVLEWHEAEPDNWEATWQRIHRKYHLKADYRRFSCPVGGFSYNIDAKINGAYIVMGLLYGNRDIERTTVISMRCGQDSDCNPSNAAGILCTTMGMKKLPSRYTRALDRTLKFSHTPYDFDALLDVCEKLARAAVIREGGRIEKDPNGAEVFVIPVQTPKPGRLEQCWEPGPIAFSRFTDAEMAEIKMPPPTGVPSNRPAARIDISNAVAQFAAGWKVADCGAVENPGLRASWGGRENVLVTHPLNVVTPCVLTKKVDVPTGKTTTLILGVGHDPRGDWTLVVKTDGKPLLKKYVGSQKSKGGWADVTVDLSAYAGKSVTLSLENRATRWNYETGFWSTIAVKSE